MNDPIKCVVSGQITLTAYTDVSYIRWCKMLGWAYVVIMPDGEIIGPVKGTKQIEMLRGEPCFEQLPKDIVRRRFAEFTIKFLTDHPDSGGVWCDKRDPWHMVCHWASKAAAMRAALRGQKKSITPPAEQSPAPRTTRYCAP